ncbi:MAG: TfoX/Sxy family protein [Gemmatimonadota bacterium]|nr:TfoX/Sxy family protein [Gemmatimonadota bacterium]
MDRSHPPSSALERLPQVLTLTPKSMFGCIGVYSGDAFFAIIDGERMYFKVDEPGPLRAPRS